MSTKFLSLSETYLYKLHVVASALDRLFDQTLRLHANGLTLAQFLLLVTVSEKQAASLRQIASFLEVSAPAVKRQADIALSRGWLERDSGQMLCLTRSGGAIVHSGLEALEQHLFHIFSDSDRPLSLMEHINTLLVKTEGVSRKTGSGGNSRQ